MSNLLLGLILGLWSGVAMVLDLSGLGVRTQLSQVSYQDSV